MNRDEIGNSFSADDGAGAGGVALRFADRRPAPEVDRPERQVAGVVGPRADARDAGDGPAISKQC